MNSTLNQMTFLFFSWFTTQLSSEFNLELKNEISRFYYPKFCKKLDNPWNHNFLDLEY